MLVARDFAKMKIKLFEEGKDYSDLIYEDLPFFATFDETPMDISLINYIILMYDPESPLVKRYQNVTRRIQAAIDYVGLVGYSPRIAKEVTEYSNIKILEKIDAYVKYINIRLWSMIVVSETTFNEYQKELMMTTTGTSSKDKLQALDIKTKILKALDEIANRLDGYYASLYANDVSLEKIVKTKMITPEGIANGETYA